MVNLSEINFRILAYEVNVGIYVCDSKGTFIYANLALADIFKVEHPKNLIGKNFKEFLSPEIANSFMIQFQESMVSSTKSKFITTQIIRQDGKSGLIEINAMPFIKDQILSGNQGVVYDITRLKQAENQMMYTSTHDPLTGIYNRTFFEAEMKRLERGRQFPISMIVVIVEGLKNLCEPEKNQDGDKIIIRIARQLFYTFRGDDIVARVGENEFGILLPIVDENSVEEISRRVHSDLLKITEVDKKPALEFFIGVDTANNVMPLSSVLQKAEAIAYLKKKSKLNR